MFAIIEIAGTQHRVERGETIKVPTLPDAEQGKTITLTNVTLVVDGEKSEIGLPYVKNAKVTAEVIGRSATPKIIAFKKKRRKGYRRTIGNRQKLTHLRIVDIELTD